MEKRKLNNEGFSLVELIVVIAIMAILVGVLAPQFIKYVEKSRVSKDMQNAAALKTAVEVYAAGNEGLDAAVVITYTAADASNPARLVLTGGKSSGNLDSTDLSGVNPTVNLSSKNWTKSGNGKFTYSTSYAWSADGDAVNDTVNKLSDVFK